MALTTTMNDNRSATTKNLAMPVANTSDFVEMSRSSTEAVYADIKTPADAQRKVRFAFSPIANVYKGTGIDPGFQFTSKRGLSALCQSTFVATTTDSEDSDIRIDWPISIHTVLRMPVTAFITPLDITHLIQDHISDIFQCPSTADSTTWNNQISARIDAWRRGYLKLGVN